jgi:RNA polymerase sigma-70 factor (ECF subfamily)
MMRRSGLWSLPDVTVVCYNADVGEPATDTAALVHRARAGDREAFAALMERYQDGVFGHLLARCGDPRRAAEIAQDAFITAFTTLNRIEKPASFRSWVIGIGLNLLRRRTREVANSDLLLGARDGRDEGLSALANGERLAAVRKALDQLPENYRAVLTLHYFDKQRGRAIGEELGLSEGAVHMMMLRARKALAERLKDFAPGND